MASTARIGALRALGRASLVRRAPVLRGRLRPLAFPSARLFSGHPDFEPQSNVSGENSNKVQEMLQQLVSENKVVLFMKGSPDMPQCGFSRAVAQALQDEGFSEYAYVDVLKYPEVREGVKKFSDWPTIPQFLDLDFCDRWHDEQGWRVNTSGSGTGYFNCIVSEFTGPHAANHGVEIWPETVAHAKARAASLGKHSLQFTVGNIYQLNVNETMRYDRIYVGACANLKSKYLYRLLEVGGILIGPFQVGHSQQLRRVVRQTDQAPANIPQETHFFVEVLGSVQFACLVEPMQCTRSAVFAPPPRTAPHTEEVQHAAQSGSTTPATMSSGDGSDAECHQPIGLPGVPFTFSLSESPWTPERSWLYPASFKQAVATGLLCRPKGGIVGLPAEIWIKHIIPWCSRRWFEADRLRGRMSDSEMILCCSSLA
eukprot:g13049.t1